jgi:alkylation response protein AidB-like acyl-CoA dehydrogenase
MNNLPQERLSLTVGAVAATEGVLAETLDYVKQRNAFGSPISGLQNTQFVLADQVASVTCQPFAGNGAKERMCAMPARTALGAVPVLCRAKALGDSNHAVRRASRGSGLAYHDQEGHRTV